MGIGSKRFRERLGGGDVLLLDAAMGTELQRREARTSLPLWSALPLVEDPELVWTIHCDEVAAGAEILTANTFRTRARSLAKGGLAEQSGELSALAVRLAHQAAATPGREVFVAGSLSPLRTAIGRNSSPTTRRSRASTPRRRSSSPTRAST